MVEIMIVASDLDRETSTAARPTAVSYVKNWWPNFVGPVECWASDQCGRKHKSKDKGQVQVSQGSRVQRSNDFENNLAFFSVDTTFHSLLIIDANLQKRCLKLCYDTLFHLNWLQLIDLIEAKTQNIPCELTPSAHIWSTERLARHPTKAKDSWITH